jgi:hypothetical protein
VTFACHPCGRIFSCSGALRLHEQSEVHALVVRAPAPSSPRDPHVQKALADMRGKFQATCEEAEARRAVAFGHARAERRAGLREITRATESAGGYELERRHGDDGNGGHG